MEDELKGPDRRLTPSFPVLQNPFHDIRPNIHDRSMREDITNAYRDTWAGEIATRIQLFGGLVPGYEDDPEFNPMDYKDEMIGRENMLDELMQSRSKPEFDAYIRLNEEQLRLKSDLAGAGLFPHLVAGIADPTNLIPVPLLKGVGFVRGALRGSATIGAVNAPGELLRADLNTTEGLDSAIIPIMATGMFGGVMGSAIGGLTRHGFNYDTIVQNASERYQRGVDAMERRRGGAARAGRGDQVDPTSRPDPDKQDASFSDVAAPRTEATAPVRPENDNVPVSSRSPVKRIFGTPEGRRQQLEENLPADLKEVWPRTANGRLKLDKATLAKLAKSDPRVVVNSLGEIELSNLALDGSLARGTGFEPGHEDVENLEVAAIEAEIRQMEIADKARQDTIEALNARDEVPNEQFLGKLEEAHQESVVRMEQLHKEIQRRKRGGLEVTETPAPESIILGGYEPIDPNMNVNDLVKSGVGLENLLAAGGQLPYFVIKNNVLPGNLHRIISGMADEISGDPSMTLVGNFTDHANSKSVYTFSQQYNVRYKTADEGIRGAWLSHIGRMDQSREAGLKEELKDSTRALGKNVADRARALVDGDMDGVKNPPAASRKDGAMTFAVFSEEATKAWIRNRGAHNDPDISRASKAIGEFFESIGKDAEKYGVIGSSSVRLRHDRITTIRDRRVAFLSELDDSPGRGPALERIKAEVEQEIVKMDLELDDLADALDAMENYNGIIPGGETAYFTRVWRLDQIDVNPEGLRAILRQEYQKSGGTPDEITERINETMAVIQREAQMVDTEGHVIGKMTREEARQARTDRGETPKERTRKRLEQKQKQAIADGKDTYAEALGRAIEKLDIDEFHYKPSPTISRKVSVGNADVLDYIETNPLVVMQHYLGRMAPAIEMARKYGDHDMTGRLAQLDMMVREARVTKQLSMGNSTPEEIALADGELVAEWAKQRKALENLRDMTLGIYGIPEDPSAWTESALQTMKAHQIVTKFGRAGQTVLADLGRTIMATNFADMTDHAWARALNKAVEVQRDGVGLGKNEWEMANEELLLTGEISESFLALRTKAMTGLGGNTGYAGAAARWMQGQSAKMMVYSLLAPTTDIAKRIAGGLIQHRILEYALMARDGRIKAGDLETITLLRAGITLDDAIRIADEWERAGALRGDHILLANTTAWEDGDLVRLFRAAIMDDVRGAVMTPGPSDKPLFMTNSTVSTLLQFKQFPISATSRFTLSAMQQGQYKRALVFQGVMASLALAYMVGLMRDNDFNDEPLIGMGRFLNAVDMSGATGIFSDINAMVEAASDDVIGIRPLLGIEPMIKDKNFVQRAGALLGPSFSSYAGLMWALTSPDADGNDTARALRYQLPFNNLWVWNDTAAKITRSVGRAIDEE